MPIWRVGWSSHAVGISDGRDNVPRIAHRARGRQRRALLGGRRTERLRRPRQTPRGRTDPLLCVVACRLRLPRRAHLAAAASSRTWKTRQARSRVCRYLGCWNTARWGFSSPRKHCENDPRTRPARGSLRVRGPLHSRRYGRHRWSRCSSRSGWPTKSCPETSFCGGSHKRRHDGNGRPRAPKLPAMPTGSSSAVVMFGPRRRSVLGVPCGSNVSSMRSRNGSTSACRADSPRRNGAGCACDRRSMTPSDEPDVRVSAQAAARPRVVAKRGRLTGNDATRRTRRTCALTCTYVP